MGNVYIIAEAGVNHNGSLVIAKKMIDCASEAGADAVKFQTFKTANLVLQNADKAEYQKQTTDADESQFDMIKKLELDLDAHVELMNYSKKKGITFLSTPFDHDSIDLLEGLAIGIYKIPSGEITNRPYLEHIGKFNKKIVLSTGMSNLGEVEEAIKTLVDSGTQRENITVLHANSQYPTPMEDVNLKAMVNLGNAFGLDYGYSDHTLGIEVPIAAVALGASVVEKHFTLDREMEGPDHKASLEPEELKSMVSKIRNIETALGNGVKRVTNSELGNVKIARKSIVAKKHIKAGDLFDDMNLAAKRPGSGISPMRWAEIVGRTAAKDFNPDDIIEL